MSSTRDNAAFPSLCIRSATTLPTLPKHSCDHRSNNRRYWTRRRSQTGEGSLELPSMQNAENSMKRGIKSTPIVLSRSLLTSARLPWIGPKRPWCLTCPCCLVLRDRFFDYNGLRLATIDYNWLQLASIDYNWLQLTTIGYNWLQLATNDYKWLQLTTNDYNSSNWPGGCSLAVYWNHWWSRIAETFVPFCRRHKIDGIYP
jgi:hypothetical protein